MVSKLVPIALIARPHGVDGEVRLKLYNEDTTIIAKGRSVILLQPEDERRKPGAAPDLGRKMKFSSVRRANTAMLVRFEGESGRDAAEKLRGMEIAVPRDELPELPDGEFYACDVEGARVELVSGDVIGTVSELVTYPTCNVFRVVLTDGKTIEVPVVDGYVALVDTDAHLIKLNHIEDL